MVAATTGGCQLTTPYPKNTTPLLDPQERWPFRSCQVCLPKATRQETRIRLGVCGETSPGKQAARSVRRCCGLKVSKPSGLCGWESFLASLKGVSVSFLGSSLLCRLRQKPSNPPPASSGSSTREENVDAQSEEEDDDCAGNGGGGGNDDLGEDEDEEEEQHQQQQEEETSVMNSSPLGNHTPSSSSGGDRGADDSFPAPLRERINQVIKRRDSVSWLHPEEDIAR